MLLNSTEEKECIGVEICTPSDGREIHESDSKVLCISSRELFIDTVEKQLQMLLRQNESGISVSQKAFPFDAGMPLAKTELGAKLLEQLRLS